MSPAKSLAEPNVILRCLVGSGAHGLAQEGTDDRDELGVCLEPPECVIGLQRFEQWEYRTALERARHQPQADQRRHGPTPPSQPGDLDLTVYSLRKWARLAGEGNPTVLLLLFSPPLPLPPATDPIWQRPSGAHWRQVAVQLGYELQFQSRMFASQQAGQRFLGYLRAQRERLDGKRGQMRVTRTELVERHGYDVKYAAHAVRLGYQGVEYMRTARLRLPMSGEPLENCLAIRRGELSLADVLALIAQVEGDLEWAIKGSRLPERADWPAINQFLVYAYATWWNL